MNEQLFLSKEPYDGPVKTAATTLSRDGDKWEQDILQTLHREHPFIADQDIQVRLSRIDAEQGVGVGAIQIGGRVVIPIIVDKFRLAPLDLYWFENELHPLTRTSFEAVMQNTDVGTPVEPGQGEAVDASLYSRTQPPFDGKYTYAQLATVAGPEKLAEALSASFGADGLRYEIRTNRPFSAVLRDALTGPVEKTAAAACRKPALTVRTAKPFGTVKTAGVYEIAAGGRLFPALVFDRVLSVGGDRGQTKVAMAVGLTPDAPYVLWSGGETAAGREIDAERELPSDAPRSDDRGVFYKLGTDGFVCTDPLTIDCGIRDDGYAVCDAFGRSFRLFKVAGVKTPFVAGDRVTLPASWRWMKIGEALRPMPPAAASELTTPRGVDSFSVLHHGGRFTVRGLPGFPGDGDAWDKTAEALSARFEARDVEAALSVAETAGAVHLCFPREHRPVVKTAEKWRNYRAPRLCKEASYIRPCGSLTCDFGGTRVKLAAVDDDRAKTTVDALLGLGFISPENLPRFVDKLPMLEDARKVAAKLLLASRLGLEVDSRPLRTAMFALDAVVRDLRELQNAAEVQEQES